MGGRELSQLLELPLFKVLN